MDAPKTFGRTPETLLERDQELDALRELAAAAAGGRGAAAFVVGPAGIGKSSLLAAAGELATGAGMAVLRARGGELERDYPHGVVRQLFERQLRELDGHERAGVLEGAPRAAAPVLGLDHDDVPPDQSPFAVLHGLYWLCANLAQRQPLALLADDLHWADDASLRFLSYVARRIADLPLLLVGAARPPVDTAQGALLDGLTDDPAAARLAPSPLSAAAVGALLGQDADPRFVDACHAATRGNPFLCRTLRSAIEAEGIAAVAQESERVTELAAGAVSREVLRRIGRLPPAAVALVRAVAVLGTRAEFRHAAALAGLTSQAAAEAADALAAQGLLRGAAHLDFVHPLLRAAVADRIPPAERGLLHARAARLMESDGVAPARLAPHLLMAPPVGDEHVVATLSEAARTVAGRGDPASAVRYLRRAVQEPPAPATRAAVLHALGVAELHAGDTDDAAHHLREALAASDGEPELRVAAGRDLSLALRALRRYGESVPVADAVVDELRARDPDRALRLTAELHQTAMMDPAAYATVAARLDLDHPVRADTPGERAYQAALATETALRNAGAAAVRARADVAFAGGLVEEDDPHLGLWANVAFPLVFAEGFTLAAPMCEAALARAHEQGSPAAIARALSARAMLHLRTGAVREAAADARTALDVGAEAAFHTRPMAIGVLLEALVERGELDAADAVLVHTGSEGELPVVFLATWALLGRGVLHLARGRVDDAIDDLREVGRRGREEWARPWCPGMFPYRAPLAAALLRTGERDLARAVADEDVALARAWGGARAIGIALRARGLASGAVADLEESVAVLAQSGAPLEHARSLAELGSAIARTGRRVDAREPLQAGMELAHRCGATVLTEQARTELVAAGARPRRIVRSGVDALTPSELRVARMAADGMTNREIAQALFVTLRTVEVHLTHAYQKLGVSRDGLAAALS